MNLITPFILSFVLSLLFTPLVIRLAHKYSLIDNPTKRKKTTQTHIGSIPRAGGLAIGAAILLAIFIMLPLTKLTIGIILAILITIIIGIIDDIKESNPYLRFISNLVVAGIIVGVGVGIPFITNPFNGAILLDKLQWTFEFLGQNHSILIFADLAALIWIVWTMNIVGWSGGVDGQLPGFVTIAAFVIGILSFNYSAHDVSQITVATLALITAGAYAGFLPWNFYPQKIMPGYSGKSLAGLLLATLSILSGAKLGTALLVLSIPMTDAAFTLLRRIAKGKSPFWADKGHLHHKLLERGWGRRKIALFYWFTSGVLGLIALSLTSTEKKFFAAALIITIVLMFLTWLHQATNLKKKVI